MIFTTVVLSLTAGCDTRSGQLAYLGLTRICDTGVPQMIDGEGYCFPSKAYVTEVNPFFADAECKGDLAWGTSLTPGDSGTLYTLVVTTETGLVWSPTEEVLDEGYVLHEDMGMCLPISDSVIPPGGSWLRWEPTPLSEYL